MKRSGHFVICGRVQGVCFRMDACEQARARGLVGWVRNRPDGTVEVKAEGEEEALDSFLTWCRRGPPLARVTEVRSSYQEASGEFSSFDVCL